MVTICMLAGVRIRASTPFRIKSSHLRLISSSCNDTVTHYNSDKNNSNTTNNIIHRYITRIVIDNDNNMTEIFTTIESNTENLQIDISFILTLLVILHVAAENGGCIRDRCDEPIRERGEQPCEIRSSKDTVAIKII